MRRRIVAVGLVTAAVALALFVVPLGLAVRQLYLTDEQGALERLALQAAIVVDPAFAAGDPVELPVGGPAVDVALYDTTGRRVAGSGPDQPGPAVRGALGGKVTRTDQSGILTVAVPVSANERVIGAVRAATPASTLWGRLLQTWLGMAALAALAVSVAVVVARQQAAKLTEPLEALAVASQGLGHGDFEVRITDSGIAEVDRAGQALNATAARLGELVARERAFAANASHQLRTPLTGLRLRLESALGDSSADLPAAAAEALLSVDQLERTISDLISLTNGERHDDPRDSQQVDQGLAELRERWHGALAAQTRALRIRIDEDAPPTPASPRAVRQILDVLLDNAVRHGTGTVTVHARDAGTALAIDVADQGPGVDPALGNVFERGVSGGAGDGIGLAMAAELARDQGGRLLLGRSPPSATFTVLLPTPEDAS